MRTQRKFTGIMPSNSKRRSLDHFFNKRYRNLLDMGDVTDVFNYPMINEKENDSSISLELAIPGVEKEDINVYVEDGYIQVMIEDSQKINSTADDYRSKEFSYYSLNQKFSIPENAEEESISANYRNGVLYIEVPVKHQSNEALLKRKIDVI